MKIALCLSGLLHGFEKAFPFLEKNLIDTLHPDVFIHTWDAEGKRTLKEIDELKISEETKKEIIEMCHPKEIVFEPFFIFDNPGYRSICNVASTLSMFYKVEKCNDLKKEYEKMHNFTYDAVIRCRFDFNLETPLRTDDLIELREWIYIPEGGDWGGVNDQFAISCSHNMDIYSALFSCIDRYYRSGCVFCPEILLQHHLEENFLPQKRIVLQYSLAASPRTLVRDIYVSKETAYCYKRVWLVSLDEIRIFTVRIKNKLFLTFLVLLLLRKKFGTEEQCIFLASPPDTEDKRIKLVNSLHRIWRIINIRRSKKGNRFKLIFCNPEEINRKIENIRNYYKKMGTPLSLVTHFDRSGMPFR